MTSKPKVILILATMDTKGPEALYLRNKIEELGEKPLLMDFSTKGGRQKQQADIPASEVTKAGNATLKKLASHQDRDASMDVMVSGAVKIAQRLRREGRINGVLGIGGYSGFFMASEVMRSLPFGFPKILVSSAAAFPGLSTRLTQTSDIVLFNSVVEIAGLTGLLKNVLDRAALGMVGMVQGVATEPSADRMKAIAMTMLSPCEGCARAVRAALEKRGYPVVGFHATGIGDRAMEAMISEGLFRGVIDLAPGGVGEHLYGFTRDAGPDRLESAGRMGIPQLISTCGVNHITPRRSKYTHKHEQRRRHDIDKLRTWLRMSPRELKEVAVLFAEKLNLSRGPVKIVIPLLGWSSVDVPGNATYDPQEDRIFNTELRKSLKKDIEIVEVDANMEDPHFARTLITIALDMFKEVRSHA
ncbi:MAG: Tm-1-like ATP-binding domain-containing protein [Deltaproteobacteria bacterium]